MSNASDETGDNATGLAEALVKEMVQTEPLPTKEDLAAAADAIADMLSAAGKTELAGRVHEARCDSARLLKLFEEIEELAEEDRARRGEDAREGA